MEHTTSSPEETKRLASQFIKSLVPLNDTALIVGLSGDLGSGKTVFSQGVAEALNVKEQVTSPTFVILKTYDIVHVYFEKFVHVDAYRLLTSYELEALKWDEVAKNPKHLILIEWPERVENVLPKDYKKIYFTFVDEKTRKIKI